MKTFYVFKDILFFVFYLIYFHKVTQLLSLCYFPKIIISNKKESTNLFQWNALTDESHALEEDKRQIKNNNNSKRKKIALPTTKDQTSVCSLRCSLKGLKCKSRTIYTVSVYQKLRWKFAIERETNHERARKIDNY